MAIIYEPKGKAGEYSPLAVNIYKGCDHKCFYCYVPSIMTVYNKGYNHNIVEQKNNFLTNLRKEAETYTKGKKQVLLSFTSDPYCSLNDTLDLTKETINILCSNKFPVAILTKGGERALKDLPTFIKYKDIIKVGSSLTLFKEESIRKHESGASLYKERENLLKQCNMNDIKTWASIEPVIYPEETLEILQRTVSFVNQYKIGKLNHFKEIESKINWTKFLYDAVKIMRDNKKMFMIKEDLAKYDIDNILTESEKDSTKMFITIKENTENSIIQNSLF